jgi:hypothetical protein
MAPPPPTKKGGPRGKSPTADDRVSGRPTLVPSVGPEVHAERTLRDAETAMNVPDLEWPGAQKWTPAGRGSQLPTLRPPSAPDALGGPLRAGESQRPTATDLSTSSGALDLRSALDFVDGHLRESVSPGTADPKAAEAGPHAAAPNANVSISDLFAVGDFTGALSEAERRLSVNPEDDEALRYHDECRRTLTRMYTARLAPLERAVRLIVPPGEIRWLTLDHRAGFLISRIDGLCSVEDLLDVSGMPRLDALKILHELVNRGVVAVG